MATLIAYKKAGLKYERVEELEAGIELAGHEVKALRAKHGSLDGAHVVVRGGQAYLVGMSLPAYQTANTPGDHDPERARRLLLKKSELHLLADQDSRKGLTLVPIELYTKGRNIKVRVAIVRGKGKADKREDLKKRDARREAERVMKTR
jgi:SsrA-binding protein